jgi:uncharacterized tellurite resistance protein B-like protein
MLRICLALLLTFFLAAQDTSSYIDLRGRPKPGDPLVAEVEGANAIFYVGESQIVLENYKFRKPWIGTWQIVFNVRNRTEHHLESVILAFAFVSKSGEELSDPRKLVTLRVPDLPDTESRALPFAINIPADLRPEKSKDAETVRAYLVSFKAHANNEDLAAARIKERKEREDRLAAMMAGQERAEAEARAQREKEEIEKVDAEAVAKKVSALKATEAARGKQQEVAPRKATNGRGLVVPPTTRVTPSVGDTSSDSTPTTTMELLFIVALIFGGFTVAYSRSGAARARKIARGALATLEDLDRSIKGFQNQTRQATELAARNYVVGIQTTRLKEIPIEAVKSLAPGVRLQALRSARIETLADVEGRSPSSLMQIRGIGQDSATRISAAAAILITNSNKRAIPVSWPGREGGAERPMLEAICHQERSRNWFADPNGQFPRLIREFKDLEDGIRKKSTRLKWALSLVKLADTTIALEMAESLRNRLGEGSEAGQLTREFNKCLQDATTEFRVGLHWTDLVQDMALHADSYKDRLTSLLGAWLADSKDNPRPTSLSSPVLVRPVIKQAERAFSIEVRSTFQEASTPLVDLSKFWIPKGQEVTICGFRIPGGMIYTGPITTPQGGRREASLIDPKLAIQAGAADCRIRKMGYWPSYESIEPDARASYLEWLSTGRSDPNADIGYVFLFFYGLERRVLVDAPHDPMAKAELAVIESELLRLLGLYSSGSFIGYATSLLDYIRATRGVWESASDSALSNIRGVPFVLKAAIGRLSQEGQPLGVDLAYDWYRTDPTTRRRTPMDRCPDLFKVAFATEFTRLFPQGLKLPQNKTKLKVSHRAASSSLLGGLYSVDLDLPDVSVLSSPVQKLQGVGETAVASLEQYSRFIGKNPSQEKTLDALLLLPKNFWPEVFLSPLLAMLGEIESAGRPRFMHLLDLQLLLPEGMDFTKGSYNSLCRGLESIGLGIEPDIQFGGGVPEIQDPVVLFEARDKGGSRAPSPGFNGAAILLQLASAVAGADGDFGEAEARLMLGHINQGLALPGDEIRRLQARLELFRRNPPPLTGLKRKIDSLEMDSKKAIGEFLVQVVHVDGVVAPEEVRSLEKVFKLLGLDTSTLYSQIHGASTEPVQVRVASEEGTTFRIPDPPKPMDLVGPLKLDMAKVAALKADSIKVSALLGAIFSEAPPSERPHPDSVEGGDNTVSLEASGPLPALDSEHQDLLQTLLQRPQWSRAELEEICADRGLMVDGAIERINEAAFEQYDQPIIEGDDPLDVNRELTLEIA